MNAAAEFLTDRYIQHNPQVPTGKSGFMQAIPYEHWDVIQEIPDKMAHENGMF